MRVLINGRFLSQKLSGVQRFASEIVKSLSGLGVEVTILMPQVNFPILNIDGVNVVKFGRLNGHLWEQLELPIYLSRIGNPLLLNLCNTAPVFYKNNIVTIHDLSVIHHPEWFNKYFSTFYRFVYPRIVKKAKCVLTVSQYVKSDICSYYNIKDEDVRVVYNGVSDLFFSLDNAKRDDFILTVGSIDPRKNLDFLIRNMRNFPDIKLVVVGGKNKIFSSSADNSNTLKNVLFTGRIDDSQLIGLYQTARLFVYPTLFEGFGIPPIEAQKCGCPVLSSDAACLPEVLGSSAKYFNPQCDVSFLKEFNSLYFSKESLDILSKHGEVNAERFSWDKSAEILLSCLKDLV